MLEDVKNASVVRRGSTEPDAEQIVGVGGLEVKIFET